MARTKNEQLVVDFFETLSSGDLEKLRGLFHKKAVWKAMARDIPGAGEHVGRDHIVDEFLAPIRGMFEPGDPKIEIKTLISKGPLVATETLGLGRMKNGKEYHNLYCWVFEIKGDKVFSIHEYMDSHYVMGLVGPDAPV